MLIQVRVAHQQKWVVAYIDVDQIAAITAFSTDSKQCRIFLTSGKEFHGEPNPEVLAAQVASLRETEIVPALVRSEIQKNIGKKDPSKMEENTKLFVNEVRVR